jgi:NAD(P)H-dependent flavin oxidoreductase YrpB (nitropropane dioxygenase family)
VNTALRDLGLSSPVIAAPMAGGPSTPELVLAAASVGSLGFLAGGYRTAEALAEQIASVRASAGAGPFGVNLFAPNPVPVDATAFRRYAATLQREADEFGLDLRNARAVEDDDHWTEKIALLLAEPVAVASFTFGIPPAATVAALRRAGTLVVQTVTSADEAKLAEAAGVDLLAVQAAAAGGHSGTLTPERLPVDLPLTELLAQVRAAVAVPLVAAGGLATPAAVAGALAAGAEAVMVGTVLLRSDESGANQPHRTALADAARTGTRGDTVVTRAFTGRPARALPNRFTERYSDLAPGGYPALHHLTSPLRKAAVAAGDPERVNLWAGTGYRHASAEPAARILTRLAGQA